MDSSTDDRQNPRIAAIIVAAGRGARAGATQGPKQYRRIGGRAIIARTIEAFSSHPDISSITIVIHRDDEDLHRQAAGEPDEGVRVVFGGETRQQSVLQGLLSLAGNAPDFVLIHDGARPFIDKDTIDRTIAAVTNQCGALPAMAISDTLKRTKDDGVIADTVPRDRLFGAQTPQAFPFAKILDAHKSAAERRLADFTDDAAIAEWAGLPVRVVQGTAENIKLTWAQDIEMADRRLNEKAVRFPDVRTGNGYDVHAFEPGDNVTLCGIAIPHHVRLSGHSDADVGLHALTDALLATCGAGDIGTHFPPSDAQWKGAASHLFVEHAVSIIRAKGGRIANADITLICEAPRIGPHRHAMTSVLAQMLAIDVGRISVKATTNERLGFIGREEGIAAIATATVVFPGELP